ncbi:MAG: c-type cytochrome domain-containing protein, partial [Planctomycetota bacterium]|nr:c-type cytochrome domain-containing protein [Planctomycetota bacterium]
MLFIPLAVILICFFLNLGGKMQGARRSFRLRTSVVNRHYVICLGTLSVRQSSKHDGIWNYPIAIMMILLMFHTRVGHAKNDEDFFESRVRPLLIKHCQECHGSQKQESGLRLDSRDGWLRGGDRGPAIIAGQPETSLLILALKHQDPDLAMPPSKKLADSEIADLEAWIKRGAIDPRRETPQTKPAMSLKQAQSFWSFQPLNSGPVSPNPVDTWSRNSVDTFVWSQL